MHHISQLIFSIALLPSVVFGADSTCFGKVGNGRLENGVKIPADGKNYKAYSSVGVSVGRTYLHSKVLEVVLGAYKELEQSAPQKTYVYGETGWKDGGRIRPHRTHQNGLSVDFMVPVKDKNDQSIPLPASPLNKFGYGIEFDHHGRYDDLVIDFEAMAEHLYQLSVAAKKRNIGITLVIFDPPLMPLLYKTKRGPYLLANLPFMKGHAWVRHDEHYHLDFSVPCKPLKG